MNLEEMKYQIAATVKEYIERFKIEDPETREEVMAALLSGISLTVSFLAKHDGDRLITPQFILKATTELAQELGFGSGRLNTPQ